ncbi:MAG: hypothetical protein ACK4NF_02475 [Planctomycetota bacterium]
MTEKKIFQLYESEFLPEDFQYSILKVLEQKSKEIIEKTTAKVEEIVNKGYQDGFQKGYIAGQEKLEREKEAYLEKIENELVNMLTKTQEEINKVLDNYKDFITNLSKLFVRKFLSKYIKENIKNNENVLLNAIDEVFQYISTSTTIELHINKRYESVIKKWEDEQEKRGSRIKLVLSDISDDEAIILGRNIYAKIDFEEIVNSLIARFFV